LDPNPAQPNRCSVLVATYLVGRKEKMQHNTSSDKLIILSITIWNTCSANNNNVLW